MSTYGVYVHVPFCVRKCNYCSFVSYAISSVDKELVRRYITSVARERELLDQELLQGFTKSTVSSLYFGGGTPTSLPEQDLLSMVERVIDMFTQAGSPGTEPSTLEVTVEANPGTVDRPLLANLRALGVNRISLGVQAFSDELLRFLGRLHTARDALRTIEAARDAGFRNLSIDLIFGIPGQTLDQWRYTLRTALSVQPEHISAYELSAEEGTPLHGLLVEGNVQWPQEESVVEMWHTTEEILCSAGYEHYEVSNYARAGYRCRHNMNYWKCGNYLGLGAGAHSHLNGVRWWNTGDVGDYCSKVEGRKSPIAGMERLSSTEQATEKLMLGLRTSDGIDMSELDAVGMIPDSNWWQAVHELVNEGLLVVDGTRVQPTSKGLLMNSYLARVLTK